jgi:hypothetical protein
MDKLAKQLREDAAKINVEVSAQLDDRIRASLLGVTQEQPRDNLPPVGPRSMWWASSLTGIVAAAALILVLNLNQPVPVPPQNDFAVPPILTPDLIFEKAMMTEPLEQELADLEADLKKAEEAVKKEIGLFP